MKERGILFSAPMVLALLAGRKTQTRRVVKPPPDAIYSRAEVWGVHDARSCARFTAPGKWVDGGDLTMGLACPFGQPGDRLWVRETTIITPKRWTSDWALFDKDSRREDNDGDMRAVQYLATAPGREGADGWGLMATPSIFMPRWASRITLEVTGVRVERLQDIGEDDAKAEGAFFTDYGKQCFHNPGCCGGTDQYHPQRNGWAMQATSSNDECLGTARMAFGNLWNRINGEGAWDSNPWVWVVEFKRVVGARDAA